MISLGSQHTIRIAISNYTCLALNGQILNKKHEVAEARDKLSALIDEEAQAGEDVSEIMKDIEAVDWYDENKVRALREKYKSFPKLNLPQRR